MNTLDIHGARSDTTRLGNFQNTQRRDQVRQPHNNEDIVGSTVGTLRKAMQTNRMSNPLQPVYQIPGRDEPSSLEQLGSPYKDMSSMRKSLNA